MSASGPPRAANLVELHHTANYVIIMPACMHVRTCIFPATKAELTNPTYRTMFIPIHGCSEL